MPTIQPLSYAGLDYLRSFGVVAVAVSPSGRVFVSRDPKGAAAAWWTKSEFADQIANVAWMNGDVPGAAARLGLTVTAHDTVLRRVAEKTAALDKAIAEAIDAGTLRTFNRTYRERRLAAKRDGKPFMPYSQALAKLRGDRRQRRSRRNPEVIRERVRRSPAQPLGALDHPTQCVGLATAECPLLAQSGHADLHCTCPLSGVKRTLPRLKRCCIDCNAMQTRRRTYGRRSDLISHLLGTYLLGAGRRCHPKCEACRPVPTDSSLTQRPARRALETRQKHCSAGRPS